MCVLATTPHASCLQSACLTLDGPDDGHDPVEGPVAQEMMHGEAARLVEASYGDVLLKTIGRCYETAADIYLGNPFESAFMQARSKTHAIKTHWRVASQSLKLMSVQQELERQERYAAATELCDYCCSEC